MSVLVAMQHRHGTAFIAMSLFCYVRNALNTVILYQLRIAYNFAFCKLENLSILFGFRYIVYVAKIKIHH